MAGIPSEIHYASGTSLARPATSRATRAARQSPTAGKDIRQTTLASLGGCCHARRHESRRHTPRMPGFRLINKEFSSTHRDRYDTTGAPAEVASCDLDSEMDQMEGPPRTAADLVPGVASFPETTYPPHTVRAPPPIARATLAGRGPWSITRCMSRVRPWTVSGAFWWLFLRGPRRNNLPRNYS